MKIGYIPSLSCDLLKEIDFAKKNFDFVEITLEKRFKISQEIISKAREKLKDFLAIGHIHWDLNPDIKEDYKEIWNTIQIFSKIGIKTIIIHPKNSLTYEKNIFYLKKFRDHCSFLGIELLIENMVENYGTFEIIDKILNETNLNLALDTGHCNQVSKNELDKFLKIKRKIRHIHIHHTNQEKAHLFFEDFKQLKELMKKIEGISSHIPITLEMFKLSKQDSITEQERKNRLLEHKKVILSL
jgi:sugar phosphate isomerase/epimerase